nr:hypothetical protein [Pseudomonas asuensis]
MSQLQGGYLLAIPSYPHRVVSHQGGIPMKPIQIRFTRPTDQPEAVAEFYKQGLGLPELARFEGMPVMTASCWVCQGERCIWSLPNMNNAAMSRAQ